MKMSASVAAVKSDKTNTHVTFVCQKCAQPIKLNRSLNPRNLVEITEEAERKLGLDHGTTISGIVGDGGEKKAQEGDKTEEQTEENLDIDSPDLAPVKRVRSSPLVNRRRLSQSRETVSVIYGSLRPDKKNHTFKQVQIAVETFKMLSTHTDVDHPLCDECPEAILDAYDHQITQMEEAKHHYEDMATKLVQEVEEYESGTSELDAELEKLRKEEEMLRAKLLKTEENRKVISREMVEQKEREKRLKREEEAYWQDFNEHQHKMLRFKDEQQSLQYRLQYTTEQLNRLKKTNVLNSAFHIWHNGHFGTINGLRLGRLQTVQVDWTEINAAWGQTAFLLSTLARHSCIVFERYRLVPYGNQSFIETLDGKKKILPLYSSASFRIFTDTKFDMAMVAFLDCLNQLKSHIENNSKPNFMLPYKIDKDKIGDPAKEFYSVKTQFNTPERWTKALKFVLTNLRWALTWVAANSMQAPVD